MPRIVSILAILLVAANLRAGGPSDWMQAATNSFAHKDWNDTINQTTKAVEVDPNYVDGYTMRGQAYYQRQGPTDLTNALADFEFVLYLEPGNFNGHLGRGMVYHQLSNYAKALPDLNECLRQQPSNAWLQSAVRYSSYRQANQLATAHPSKPQDETIFWPEVVLLSAAGIPLVSIGLMFCLRRKRSPSAEPPR
ncbi:MAG TPA: tetratricopeptide repeat protein [Verrucomicrobiae bacterium]|jgi:tetratricopeptide (TPR) repeat protein|nr:tetratricopeptide repeat protein [Verrucomicrobiae bacterium]